MKPSILTTGLQGLVGSKLRDAYSDQYVFESLDIHDPVHPIDITDEQQVLSAFMQSSAQFVVHFAAFTDVTAAWAEKDNKNGLTYKVNVLGTHNIIKAATATKKHLIHISTAYVFDGHNPQKYLENDVPHPIEWYGQTKLMAEELVQSSSGSWTIFRIDQPFRSDSFPKADIIRKMIQRIKEGNKPTFFSDHYFGPTFIDDFVKVIEWVFRTRSQGLFHASSGEKWSDYEFALALCEVQGISPNFTAGSLETYLKTTGRPYQKNTSLNCEKLHRVLDFSCLSVKEAISRVML